MLLLIFLDTRSSLEKGVLFWEGGDDGKGLRSCK